MVGKPDASPDYFHAMGIPLRHPRLRPMGRRRWVMRRVPYMCGLTGSGTCGAAGGVGRRAWLRPPRHLGSVIGSSTGEGIASVADIGGRLSRDCEGAVRYSGFPCEILPRR
jgi:hypothetical protein